MAAKRRHHASKRAEHEGHLGRMENHGGRMDSEHYKSDHMRGISQGSYAGELARRTQEMEDAGMIHEDMRAIANLPQEVMIKPYPRTGPYNPEGLDDTIKGVDRQMDYDDSKRAASFYPKKV